RTQAALARLGQQFDDPTDLLDDIGASLVNSTQDRFERQAGPDGKRWAALSADTVLSRLGGASKAYTKRMTFRAAAKRKMSSMAILIQRGHLRNSITHRATRTGVEVGTAMVYGAIHQFGGKAGRGRKISIPARPYLGLDDADAETIHEKVQHWLQGTLS
ncbi:MAG: phage virion morphogenesis protein, partial [Magnetospirillum sp.]